MSRLIDADALLEHLNACLTNGRPLSNLYDLSEIVCYVKSMPTVDVVSNEDAISRKELLNYINDNREDFSDYNGYSQRFDFVDKMPTVDTVKHGKWVHCEDDDYWEWTCSACMKNSEIHGEQLNFCPNCGAKMDLTQSNDSNVLNALDEKEKYNWIILGNGEYKCSKCGDTSVIAFKKCSTCGARMDSPCADCQEFDCYGCEYKK